MNYININSGGIILTSSHDSYQKIGKVIDIVTTRIGAMCDYILT